MPKLGPISPIKKGHKKRVTIAVERLTEEEFFTSSDESDEEEESDSDWGFCPLRKTPMSRRIKAERTSLGGLVSKHKEERK